MKYTVMLLYPDYIADDFGQDTHMTCVEAESVASAQVLAQQEVAEYWEPEKFEDFTVLMVIEGEHQDIKE